MINQQTKALLYNKQASGAGDYMDIRNGQGSTLTLNVTIGNSSNVVKIEGCLSDSDSTPAQIGVISAKDYKTYEVIGESGIYFASVAGLEKIRANVTTYASGSITVVGTVIEE